MVGGQGLDPHLGHSRVVGYLTLGLWDAWGEVAFSVVNFNAQPRTHTHTHTRPPGEERMTGPVQLTGPAFQGLGLAVEKAHMWHLPLRKRSHAA